jgi:hypothetical protein
MKLLHVLIFLALAVSFVPAQIAHATDQHAPLLASGDLLWANGMGGTSNDFGLSIATDSNDNIYTVGDFYSTTIDFDPGPGIVNLTNGGYSDGFISKFDKNGLLIWAKQIGGSGFDSAKDIVLDSSNNIYVTGYFEGTVDFDSGVGIYNITSSGISDIYILKLDNDGNFVWAKSMGGSRDDIGIKLRLDEIGNVYILAEFWSTADFDPGAGMFNLTSNGDGDIAIIKLDPSGNFVWAKGFGGSSDDYGNSFSIGETGNLYITGNFDHTVDFDPNTGISNLTSNGWYDMFISVLDQNGQFLWAVHVGGIGIDDGIDIALGRNDDIYVTGSFGGTVDFDPGVEVAEITGVGLDDLYILKLDQHGIFEWASVVGGSGVDFANDIELDDNQNIYISGAFSGSVDFDPFTGVTYLGGAGSSDVFVAKYDKNGQFILAKGMGGTLEDTPYGLILDGKNNIILTGRFQGAADYDPNVGTENLTSNGENDIFIVKIEGDSPPTTVTSIARASTTPTSASSVDFTVTFSEPVTGVDANGSDFELFTSGVSDASITNVSGSGSVYTVSVNTGSGNGTIRLDVPASASISDLSGTPLSNLPFTSGEMYTLQRFTSISKWSSALAQANGWTVAQHERLLADVNGDGLSDLVGFGLDGAYVALANGSSFEPVSKWSSSFGLANGWTVSDYERTLADVDGDGKADAVGFGLDGVYVALSTGSSFAPIAKLSNSFGLANGWTVAQYERLLADVNGDGLSDLVGFGLDGVYVALATGTPGNPSFGTIAKWSSSFGLANGWTVSDYERTLADVDGDGKADAVGFGLDGVYVALAQ